MAKYQVFLALLTVSAAFAAPAPVVAEDQAADDTALLRYSASYPYQYGVYDHSVISPYAYAAPLPAVAQAVVAAPYAHALPAEHFVHPVYTPSVNVFPAPTAYAYAPARYSYAHGQVSPTSSTYTHVSRGW